MDCIIAGDSIAVGSQAFKKECRLVGQGGINTWQYNRYHPQHLNADTVVISLGTNDHIYIDTMKELLLVRQRVKARRVIWILPAGNLPGNRRSITVSQDVVREIARQYGDIVATIPSLQADRIHPSWAGYRELMKLVD